MGCARCGQNKLSNGNARPANNRLGRVNVAKPVNPAKYPPKDGKKVYSRSS